MTEFKLEALSVWEKLQNTTEPVIMYGTGNGADKVMDEFQKRNINIQGVTASSGFVRERTFRGFPVKPIEYFEELYSELTVVITFGSSIKEVMENIYSLESRHRVLVPCVPVIGNIIADRDFISKNIEDINRAYNLLGDEFSRAVYSGYINFVFSGELSYLKEITSLEDEIYPILNIGENETFVDIGAYRGDTVSKFLSLCGGKYKGIIAAEPDVKTYKKLMANCEHLENFRGENAAVTGVDGYVEFSQQAGRQSSVGHGEKTPSLTLNSLCKGQIPTFVKIDSEGCECEILEFGREILSLYKPKLNVAAYHRFEDIFKLPLLINSINKEYKIYLRHHPYIPAWDTIYYCI